MEHVLLAVADLDVVDRDRLAPVLVNHGADVADGAIDRDDPRHHALVGLRGVRLTLSREDVFRTQLRALARAAAHGNLKVMVPMVTVPDELARSATLLDAFVPPRVFDVHTHVYRWEFNTDPGKQSTPMAQLLRRTFLDSDRAALDACDAMLLPGRSVTRLSSEIR